VVREGMALGLGLFLAFVGHAPSRCCRRGAL
jgi:hypothetical protein